MRVEVRAVVGIWMGSGVAVGAGAEVGGRLGMVSKFPRAGIEISSRNASRSMQQTTNGNRFKNIYLKAPGP